MLAERDREKSVNVKNRLMNFQGNMFDKNNL